MNKILLLAEAYGQNEARINRPLVGASGIELIRMLAEAGVFTLTSADNEYIQKFWKTGDPNLLDCVWNLHPEVHRTNVFNQHPPGNELAWFCGPKSEALPGYGPLLKSKYVRKEFAYEIDRLADELVCINPNLVVCLGNCALWALLNKTGVKTLRGTTHLSTHTATGFKLLPTYHPAAVLRQWEIRPIVVMDLTKAAREGKFPEIRRPKREIWIEPTIEDVERFCSMYINYHTLLSVDIETSGIEITCIGFAPTPNIAIVIPLCIPGRKRQSYWKSENDERHILRIIKGILEDPKIKKVGQNILFDIAFLYRCYGIKTMGVAEDCMLAHHALQPESEKGLGFLGSIYCNLEAWKADHKMGTLKRDE